ncbi:MAG: alpha/beta fold hydrolase [Solirubrobacteraceae bacterium]
MRLNHYRNGHGDPLVLIHGIGSHWQMWEPVLDRLVAHRDVIALDLPGFGASAMPPAGTPAGPKSLTGFVLEFLTDAGLERPHVAGNSLGGLIALELARRGQVRSAAALSPAGFASGPETAYARGSLWAGVRLARRIAPFADGLMRSRAGRRLAVSQFVAHPTRMSAAAAAADLRALAGAPWFDATLPTLRAGHFTGPIEAGVPVTIAWGEQDRLLLPRQAARAARLMPTARMVTLHGCGHVPPSDDPEQVARVLLEASAATEPR